MTTNGINLTRAKRISGWMNDNELKFLAEVAEKSKVIIEIGSYYGRSCMAMADNTYGTIYSIDPYKGVYDTENKAIILNFDENVYKDFLYNLSGYLQSGKVKHYRMIFSDFDEQINPDFIFIDGDHSYEGCHDDINNAMRYISNGGIIAGHDWKQPGFPGIEKAVLEIFKDKKINVVDSIWWVQI